MWTRTIGPVSEEQKMAWCVSDCHNKAELCNTQVLVAHID